MKKLALLLLPLLGCEKEIDRELSLSENAEVFYMAHSLYGCGWLIKTQQDTLYPINLDAKYQVEGLKVNINFKSTIEGKGCLSYHNSIPKNIKIISLKKQP